MLDPAAADETGKTCSLRLIGLKVRHRSPYRKHTAPIDATLRDIVVSRRGRWYRSDDGNRHAARGKTSREAPNAAD